MQPIIVVSIAAVAIAGLSTGFLMQNEIDLSMVQLLGVGETDIGTPVTKANVDFLLDRATGFVDGTVLTRNVIAYCLVENNWGPWLQGEVIICKLTDANNNVVSEGQVTATTDPPDVLMVHQFPAFPLANDVTNIHDIIIVAKGVPQTGMGSGP